MNAPKRRKTGEREEGMRKSKREFIDGWMDEGDGQHNILWQ